MATAPRQDRGIRVLAGASGIGFILAICGSNEMTPLLASVGLSTGAAAAIMVAARGERGHAFIASWSLIGAGSGLVAAIAIAVFLPW